MVVWGSKMAVPSSVSSHGALPSANTSPEIRLLGFPNSVSSHGALPSANTSPEIRLLGFPRGAGIRGNGADTVTRSEHNLHLQLIKGGS